MGGAASVGQLPEACTKDECQARYGDLFNETEWQKYAVNGSMSREALAMAFADLTDAFLTHDWGTDGSTHKKVSTINKLLKARGITTWFDEEKMEGNVKKQMIHGIDNARVIVVFVTQRYIDKVGGSNAEDNCQLEFNYAARRKTASKMIPVLIDPSPSLKNPATWTGEVGFVLGGHLYLDLSNAFDDEQLLATRIDELIGKINGIGGVPIAQRFGGAIEHQTTGIPSVAKTTPRLVSSTLTSPTVPLATLSKEQVAAMLNALGCSKYSAAFLENEITGDMLMGTAEVNDIKELGVTLAVKARLLFDKITEFKANGVPTSLLAPTDAAASATEPTSARPAVANPKSAHGEGGHTFDKHIAELLPPDWVKVYNYKLEANGKNSASSHALKWPEPPCSLSISSGLFLNGNFKDELKDKYELMYLESLGGRMDKADFLLTFKIKFVQGNCTPFSAGYRPWFAIDITKDMCLIITFNQDEDANVVRKDGQPIVLPVDTWLDIGILMCLKRRTIEVVVGAEKMDPIELESSFSFKHLYTYTEDNGLSLVRHETFDKMFHGYLRKIELYSTAPAAREMAPIPPMDDNTYAKHMDILNDLKQEMKPLVHYPAMNNDVVDTIKHGTMVLPASCFTHKDYGVFFDGDYYGEAGNNWSVAVAGVFRHELKQHHFMYAIEMAPLGRGWAMCMGATGRWFAICVNAEMTVEICINNMDVNNLCCVNKEPVVLAKGEWALVAVKMDGNNIDVIVNGERMDRIELGDEFKFNVQEGECGDLRLVNYGNGGCFHGFIKSLAMWSV
ncbi:Aste57867_20905 [Aphanomyces stellatus]|uniref:Aste57867_20905 protein n=2 Tax=Aphanomyces stellatus TaxID=120398 RepID=A0A485LGV8_9STRA|nr:hypothetical protein As57867_020837 [Aphanomyces stellatus]VFT97582.1 Aste57867_20905 [Aphanomyces stellatus]